MLILYCEFNCKIFFVITHRYRGEFFNLVASEKADWHAEENKDLLRYTYILNIQCNLPEYQNKNFNLCM